MYHNQRKILILTGDAGLGHRSAAEAVRDALRNKFGEKCAVEIVNPFNHPDIPDFIRKSQSDYDDIVKKVPEVYEFAYKISDAKMPVALMEGGFSILLFQVLKDILQDFNPDLVITTYPMYPAPLSILTRFEDLAFPWITVVTDLVTVHHIWFNTDATLCTVPTQAVKEIALEAGFSEEQIINTGIPVDPNISALKQVNKADLRSELGWEKDLTTLLVVGSPRVTSLVDIIKELDKSSHPLQFALVAGGDDALYQDFQNAELVHPFKSYNFVDNLPQMMRAADLIVCKAGGLIVTESLASGLPLMLVHMLPGQEEGNVNFVLEHGAGIFCETPQEASQTLQQWLDNDGEKLKETAQKAEKIGRPNAADDIAEKAWDLLR